MITWNRAKTILVQLWRGSARRVRNALTCVSEGRGNEVGQEYLLRPRCCRTQHF